MGAAILGAARLRPASLGRPVWEPAMGTNKYRALADASDGGLLDVIKAAKPQSFAYPGAPSEP